MSPRKKSKKELLREKAEKQLSKKSPIVSKIEDKDVKKLIHELQVQRVELEMQNDKLRKAQEEIEESRTKYSNLYDFAPIGYFTFSQAGEIVEVNPTGASMLGVERSLLLHRSFAAFVDPNFRSLFRDHRLNVLRSAKRERCELKLIKKEGDSFYAHIESISVPHGRGMRIRSAITDITELKESQEKFEIEHAFRVAIEHSILSGIAAVDLDGRQTHVNLGFCRMVGRSEEELIGRTPPFAYWPPEEMDHIYESFQVLMSGKAPSEGIHLRFMRKNGERFDVLVLASQLKDNQGKVIGWIGTFGDISHFKQMEKELRQFNTQLEERVRRRTAELQVVNQELRQSERKFRILADNTYDMEFWINPEGQFVFTSPSCKRITGHDASEFMDNPNLLRNIVHPEDLGAFDKHRREEQGEVPLQELEFRIIHADGSIRWIGHVCQRIFDEEGRFLGIRASNRSITKRKRGEEALRESEAKFRELTNASPAGIVVYRGNKLLHVNPAAESISGYTRDELLAMDFLDLMHPDYREATRQHAHERITGEIEQARYELILITKSGTEKWLDVSSKRIFFEGLPAGLIVFIDINERKKTEEALAESKERYRSLATNMPSILIRYDKDLRFLFISPKAEEVTGVPIHRFIGKTNRQMGMPRNLHVLWDNAIREVFRTGQSKDLECDFQSRKGTISYYLILAPEFGPDGAVHHVLGIATDITERKAMERALRESEERYRILVETAPDAVIVHRHNRFLYSNSAALQLYGAETFDRLAVHSITDLLHPDERESIAERIRLTMSGEKAALRETRVLRLDGQDVPVEAAAAPVTYQGARAIQVILRDITERKQMERLREALNEINLTINSSLNFDEIMNRVVRQTCQGIGVESAAISLRNGDIWVVSYVHGFPKEIVGAKLADEQEPHAVLAIKTKEPVVINDGFNDARVNREHMRKHNIRSVIVIPLMTKERVIGVLFLNYHSAPVTFTQAQIDFARKLGYSLGLALENMTLFDALKKSRDELEVRVQERTAELMEAIAELQDEISERKLAEEAVRTERQRFNDVLEMLPAYVVLLTPDHHLHFANRVFRDRFGESQGKRCFEFLFGLNEPCENCETYTVLKTRSPHYWEWTGPDGRIYDIFDFPFTDVDGSPLILEMGIDITDRKRAEEALRESESRLRFLSSQLLTVQENERRSIARELHDGVGQLLTAVKFKIESALQLKIKKKSLEAVVPLLRESIEEVRRVQMDLRPSTLDDLGVLATLEWFFREYRKIYSHILIERKTGLKESDVPMPIKTVIYRVTQEALNNIAKHSRANLVRFSLNKLDDKIELTIRDDGIGFDLEQVIGRKGSRTGLGLTSMRERIELSGGSCMIESTPGQGTILRGIWSI